jgi:transketolase
MSALRKTDTERAMDYATVIAVSGDACTAPNAAFGWERHTRLEGRIIGMNTFGASAPLKELQTKFGFQPNLVAEAAKQLLQRR